MNETALQKLSKAEQWLSEAKDLTDLKEIHDIAVAAESYAKAHRLGIDAENHAREVKFLAARRIGELVPPEQGKRTDKKQTSPKVGEVVSHQRLSEFRKLAEIPEIEFKERIEVAKAKEEKITYNKFFRTPSRMEMRRRHATNRTENSSPKPYKGWQIYNDLCCWER